MKSSQVQQTEIPFEVRMFVFDRDGGYCQNPDCRNAYQNLTVHHICPRSRWGSGSNPCNLVLLCVDCHDRIVAIAAKHPELRLLVHDESLLLHREQCAFYDHEFPANYLKCSHEINKGTKKEEVSEARAEKEALKERATY